MSEWWLTWSDFWISEFGLFIWSVPVLPDRTKQWKTVNQTEPDYLITLRFQIGPDRVTLNFYDLIPMILAERLCVLLPSNLKLNLCIPTQQWHVCSNRYSTLRSWGMILVQYLKNVKSYKSLLWFAPLQYKSSKYYNITNTTQRVFW